MIIVYKPTNTDYLFTGEGDSDTVLPLILVPSKLKTNISSRANCPESFINRKEGDVSIISVCRAAG